MKNQENKPLKIVHAKGRDTSISGEAFAIILSNLAVAESNLVRAGKDSTMPHFIAIVKELEDLCGFHFEII